MEPSSDPIDRHESLALNREQDRAMRGVVIGGLISLASIAWLIVSSIVWKRPPWYAISLCVLGSMAAILAIAPAGHVQDARHIAVAGGDQHDSSLLKRMGAFSAASGGGAIAGAGLGILAAVLGGVFGGALVLFTTSTRSPTCQQCAQRHADYWVDFRCGDGFRWTQQDLNHDEGLWLTESQASAVIGITQQLSGEKAERAARALFELARTKQRLATIAGGERIQRRDLNELLLQVTSDGG
jgi:hypothetical protein